MRGQFDAVERIVRDAIRDHAFPGASLEIGRHDGARWNSASGRLTYDRDAPEVNSETVYDLASLTKVLSSASLAMRALDDTRIALADPVGKWLRDWRGTDREHVTIRHLLTHSSGLSAYMPFYRGCTGRIEFERAICTLPLEYAPDSQSVYSDLGFILLGFILEDSWSGVRGLAGAPGAFDPAGSLSEQFNRIRSFMTSDRLAFNPPRAWRAECAPTELDPWRGRVLVGEVHDENCWALGGAAGHSGLFGTASAVGAFARAVLRTLHGEPILAHTATMRDFATKRTIPGSSRALAWDTMLPTSSCGTRMAPTAIGHTGFTGTSLWIDWERDLYVVFLTNRVYPTRENNAIRQIRPRLHDAIVESCAA
jgi:serine-type D-Ala-D-Ala carboxypeptidase